MPLIKRITQDMFEFADVVDFMVNPVNLLGVPGAGLALEFRRRAPDYVERYKALCKSNDLRIGTVEILEISDQSWDMILFPTKRHFQDLSSKDDIIRGLEALQTLLMNPKYKNSVLGMPMLGCGLGKQDYPTIEPLMEDYLGNLAATVFLSMSPERTDLRPKYLTVAGPLDYGIKEKEQDAIAWGIERALAAWETSLGEYTNVISGGYPGVDAYVCGTDYGTAVPETKGGVAYQDSYVFKKTDKIPLVAKPNKVQGGVGANLQLGNLLCEIGDDVILFKPKGHNNNRLSAMQVWLQADKERRMREGLFPKRMAIFGDVHLTPTSEDILIQQSDIPY